jgi:hypothetical protein
MSLSLETLGVRAMSVTERGYLLVRRDGVLWAVENAAVESLARRGRTFRLSLGGQALGVDEIVGVVPELAVWPTAAALRWFWPEPAGGMAVHGEAPLVIVDSRRPPRALWLEDEGDVDGERD